MNLLEKTQDRLYDFDFIKKKEIYVAKDAVLKKNFFHHAFFSVSFIYENRLTSIFIRNSRVK